MYAKWLCILSFYEKSKFCFSSDTVSPELLFCFALNLEWNNTEGGSPFYRVNRDVHVEIFGQQWKMPYG